MFDKQIIVGDILIGYCEGAFGFHYLEKKVEGVGVDWVVARGEDGAVVFAVDRVIWTDEPNESIHKILAPYCVRLGYKSR